MKNIKLQKKQSFFDLYRKYIIGILGCVSVIGSFIFMIVYPELIKDILLIVAKMCGFSIAFVIISFLVDFIIFIKRQLYIPLTKDELNRAEITTIQEYNWFLIKYLRGFKPFPKLQEQIIASAKEVFAEEWKEIGEIYYCYHYRNKGWILKNSKDIQDIKRINNNTLTREDIFNSENPFYFSYQKLELNQDYKELMFHQNLLIRVLIISLFILIPTLFALMIVSLHTI